MAGREPAYINRTGTIITPWQALFNIARIHIDNLLHTAFNRLDEEIAAAAELEADAARQVAMYESLRRLRLANHDFVHEVFEEIWLALHHPLKPREYSEQSGHLSEDGLFYFELGGVHDVIRHLRQVHADALDSLTCKLNLLAADPEAFHDNGNPFGPAELMTVICNQIWRLPGTQTQRLQLLEHINANIEPAVKIIIEGCHRYLATHGLSDEHIGDMMIAVQADELVRRSFAFRWPTRLAHLDTPATVALAVWSGNPVPAEMINMCFVPGGDRASSQLDVEALEECCDDLGQKSVQSQVLRLIAAFRAANNNNPALSALLKNALEYLYQPIMVAVARTSPVWLSAQHPLCRIFDRLCLVGYGWRDVQNPQYQRIIAALARLQAAVRDDRAYRFALADCCDILDAVVHESAEIATTRVALFHLDHELADARRQVEVMLLAKTANRHLPSVVVDILEEAWFQVLFVTLINKTTAAPEWDAAMQVVDDLLDSVTLPMPAEKRTAVMGKIPGLLQQLRRGLEAVGYNAYKLSQYFTELEKVHLALLLRASTGVESIQELGLPMGVLHFEEHDGKTATLPDALRALPADTWLQVSTAAKNPAFYRVVRIMDAGMAVACADSGAVTILPAQQLQDSSVQLQHAPGFDKLLSLVA